MSRAYLAFTEKGMALAHRLARALPGSVSRCGAGGVRLAEWTGTQFAQADALIFVGAVGIAVRAIAPHLKSKTTDPAVVVLDECGRFAVPLLSGHLGGANALARALAEACGAIPVITTATDANGVFAVDEWAKAQGCAVLEPERIKLVSGALLAFTMSVDDFVISYFTAGSGASTLSMEIYSMTRRRISPEINALSTLVFVVVLLVLVIVNIRSVRQEKARLKREQAWKGAA